MSETLRICSKCGAEVPAEAPQGLCPKCVLAGAAAASAMQSAGSAAAPPPVAQVAAAFPHLEIADLIGAGGMGAVYKARQPKLERWVALKVLPENLAADPAFAERFSREARVLARLNHPNIVTIYDFGQSGGFFFLLMEYVDGVNLRDAMMAGRFTPSQALGLVPRICEALQYAHDEGILHRDIKPENILLDVKGRVKIADFGIAKLLGDRKATQLTASRMAVGTPHYMAPEQLEHPQEVDQRADIYSLGVVFYEMLTGELPIGRFAPPSAKSPVDPRVDDVVLRALEKEPQKRQHSVGEVKTQVENIASTPAAAAGPGASLASASARPSAGQGAAGAGAADGSGHAPATQPKWSRKAVAAAALSGASLVLGVSLAALILVFLFALAGGRSGIGPVEITVVVGLAALVAGLALAGMILGGMGRREVRDSQGRLRGAGLALWAMFALPLEVVGSALLSLSLFGLMYVHVKEGPTRPAPVTEFSEPVPPAPIERLEPPPAQVSPGTGPVQPAPVGPGTVPVPQPAVGTNPTPESP